MSIVDTNKAFTVTETARMLGCTAGRVRQMLLSGEITGEKIHERLWLISEREVKRVSAIRYTTGRPRAADPQPVEKRR